MTVVSSELDVALPNKLSQIEEIFDFHDRPCLFSARDAKGNLFLGIWAEESQIDSIWLYSRINDDILLELKQKRIDVRAAFVEHCLDGALYKATYLKSNGTISSKKIAVAEIDDSLLPLGGEYLIQ